MARTYFKDASFMTGNVTGIISGSLRPMNYDRIFNTQSLNREDYRENVINFNPNATGGEVEKMLLSGSNLYIGGNFTTVSGAARNRIAVVDKDNGALSPFNPDCNGRIYSIILSGSNLYIGGAFTTVSGSTRNRLAVVDKDSGALGVFNPNIGSDVNSLLISGSNLYVGGDFITVSGTTRNRLAVVDKDSGALGPFNPDCDGAVLNMILSGSNLYICGEFTAVSGSVRAGVAVVDKNSGALGPFNPSAGGGSTITMLISESNLYLGGGFTTVSGTARNRLAVVDKDSGALGPFNPDVDNQVNDIVISDSNLYICGTFEFISGSVRNGLASVDKNSGALSSFNSSASIILDEVKSFLLDETHLYAGGTYVPNELLYGYPSVTYLGLIDLNTGGILVDGYSGYISVFNEMLFSSKIRDESSYRNSFLIFGRRDNDWYLSKLSASIGTGTIQILANSGSYNFTIPVRPRKSNLLINRFSAPGDSRTMSDGNLDRESLEYSIYNQINARNLKVRGALDTSWQIPSLFGGIQSGS